MLSNMRLVTICALLFLANILLLSLYITYQANSINTLTINKVSSPLHIVSDKFLSIGIDISHFMQLDSLDLNNDETQNLAIALSPGYLRLGGTMSDRLIFSQESYNQLDCNECLKNDTIPACVHVRNLCRKKFLPFFLMTGEQWITINEFCKATNLTLLFSFNVLLRNDAGWDPTNAIELLNFSRLHNYNVDWQLGNEPNSFHHNFNDSVSAPQLADDFKLLKKVLSENGYSNSLIVGPDTTRPQAKRPECLQYMVDFLAHGSNAIDVRSWHQYYLNSRNATLRDFWDPRVLSLLSEQIEQMHKSTAEYRSIPMWLSETSSSYGGGAPGLSNTFAGTALWLDKLGLAARNNISTVIRQSFMGGNYSLVNKKIQPLPDWWISILYKRLVGTQVLSVTHSASEKQRFYCHCANKEYAVESNNTIILYGVNLEFAKPRFYLSGGAIDGKGIIINEYIVSPPSVNRRSNTILLNGRPIYYHGAVPNIKPRVIKNAKYITIPPYSVGFWVLRNTSIDIC